MVVVIIDDEIFLTKLSQLAHRLRYVIALYTIIADHNHRTHSRIYKALLGPIRREDPHCRVQYILLPY